MPTVHSHIEPVLALYVGKAIPLDEAREKARPAVMADAEAVGELVDEGLNARIRKAATRQVRHVTNGDARQGTFFGNGLKEAYALDLEERTVKPTGSLLEVEYLRAIDIRERQLAADGAHIATMRQAYAAVRPFWREFPAATYGEVERVYLDRTRGAASAA